MKKMRILLIPILSLGFATSWAANAEERSAFLASSVSLGSAIAAAEGQTGARAIEAVFVKDDGVYIYEIELLLPVGTEIEAEVDAQTAVVLEVEGPVGESEDEDQDEEEDDD